MSVMTDGKLIYDGCGKHYIRGLKKASIREQYGLAEHILRTINYADYPESIKHVMLKDTGATAHQAVGNGLQRIHNVNKTDIESKGQEPMSEDKISDIFYREYIEDELKK